VQAELAARQAALDTLSNENEQLMDLSNALRAENERLKMMQVRISCCL
jgi:hypothetical protein